MRAHMNMLVKRALGDQSGFTLVELLVVVTIVVALAAASVVSVIQFAGKGEEGATAAELDTVQAAMDAMMANTGSTSVTANGTPLTGVKDFTALPAGGATVEPLYGANKYIRDNPTTYWYCWNATGLVTQTTDAATVCP